MRFEQLTQFIVPLTFLAIWALTSLFNRETQPLPPRQGRPLGPGGPKPQGNPLGQPSALPRRAEPLSFEMPSGRMSSPPQPRRPPSPNITRSNDDILIIEDTGRSAPQEPARTSYQQGRRLARSRPPAKPQVRRPEPAKPSALSRSMEAETTIANEVGPGLKLTPLAVPHSPLQAPSSGLVPKLEANKQRAASSEPVAQSAIRDALKDPARLREAFILREIFSPPLAMRGGPTGRRLF